MSEEVFFEAFEFGSAWLDSWASTRIEPGETFDAAVVALSQMMQQERRALYEKIANKVPDHIADIIMLWNMLR